MAANSLESEYQRGYIQSWNLTLQKKLAWGFVGQAGYVATRQINQVAVAMREPIMRGRQAALRVQSASNIRQILQTCMLHANENQGQYPADMKELEKAMAKWMPEPAMVKRVLTNPRKPDVQPAYVYIKPAKGNAAPADTVVIYDKIKENLETWDWELAASRYDYRRDEQRNTTGTLTDMAGTGWNTLAAKGTWRPQGVGGAH